MRRFLGIFFALCLVLGPGAPAFAAGGNFAIPVGFTGPQGGNQFYTSPVIGSDTTGNGSVAFPFASITHANAVIAALAGYTPTTAIKYTVIALPGNYVEQYPTALSLLPGVSYMGWDASFPPLASLEVGITLDARWTGGSWTNATASVSNFSLTGGSNSLNVTANSGASLFFNHNSWGGTIALQSSGSGGINFYFYGGNEGAGNVTATSCFLLSWGNIWHATNTCLATTGSAPTGECIWESLGADVVDNLTINGQSGTGSALLYIGGGNTAVLNLTLNGTSSGVYLPSIGSIPQTVTLLNGATYPVINGLLPAANVQPSATTGQVLTTTTGGSTTAWATPSGGGGGITALTGDTTASGTGSVTATTKQAQTGEYLFGTSGTTTMAAGATVVETQASVSTVATSPWEISAQASTNANGNGGLLQLNYPVPTGSGNEGAISFLRGGTSIGAISQWPGVAGREALFLGPSLSDSLSNYALNSDGATITLLNSPGTVGIMFNGTTWEATFNNTGVQFFNSGVSDLGGGGSVVGMGAAVTIPTSNPNTAGDSVLWSAALGVSARGHLGAITTFAGQGSSGTVNSQTQTAFPLWGTAETVSSSTPTSILTITTASGVGGSLHLIAHSRATTTGTGIVVGNTAGSEYVLVYQNISGIVTLSTAGITLISGTNQTTASALTAPVLTASVATNVITIKVTNVALCTVDSQVKGDDVQD